MSGESPYKKMKMLNQNYCGYISAKMLEPNHLYKILQIEPTDNSNCGKGQLMYLIDSRNKRCKVQFPTKYLKQFSEDDIKHLKSDMTTGKNPFFVFREVEPNGSFRCDVVEKNPESDHNFKENLPMPELDHSIENKDNENNTGGNKEDGNTGGNNEDSNTG